jgi:hypothetical protein
VPEICDQGHKVLSAGEGLNSMRVENEKMHCIGLKKKLVKQNVFYVILITIQLMIQSL